LRNHPAPTVRRFEFSVSLPRRYTVEEAKQAGGDGCGVLFRLRFQPRDRRLRADDGIADLDQHFAVFGQQHVDARTELDEPAHVVLLDPLFVCELFRRSATPLANLGATLLGVLYVAVPLSLLLYVPVLAGDGVWRPETVLCYIFIIWANDVFAYLVGMTFGRHRLCERLSPKKSWEGFFGGLAGAVATGLAAAYALDANYWVWGGLALVASLSGVAGDLVESMFKREAGVKDSGQVIPGHGGVLDRFDALLLSAPYVFLYLLLVGRFV
jgi:CDP-diglyceride synthetase